jgi:hypothetical protein
MSVNQLYGIIRYELIMHWRRRALPFLLLILLIGMIGFTILVDDAANQPMSRRTYGEGGVIIDEELLPLDVQHNAEDFASLFPGETPDWLLSINFEQYQNDRSLLLVLGMLLLPLLIGITPIFAETIPLDRQQRIRDLLESLPFSKATYLGGKVFGLWAALALGLLIFALIFGVFSRLLMGDFSLSVYVALWVVMVVPPALIVSAYAVLVASGVRSRRIAALIGALLVPVSFIVFGAIYGILVISGLGLAPNVPFIDVSTYAEAIGSFLSSVFSVMIPFIIAVPVVWLVTWLATGWGYRKA